VAGVIIDYTWGGWSIHGSWEDLKRYFATNKAHFFMVDVAPVVMIGILIAAFGIANTLMMNVLERIREIGSLRAVGMTRPQVMRMILAEALIIGILGGILGVVFGTYSSYFALQGMEEGTGWEVTFVLPTSVLLTGMAIAIGVSQVAALYPAWRAASVNIVRAVRYE